MKNKIKSLFKNKKFVALFSAGCVVLIISAYFLGYLFYLINLSNAKVRPLKEEQQVLLNSIIEENYSEKAIHPLPYDIIQKNLKINAKSAILADYNNGWILYEKDADQQIPPASMTKLVLMYTALREIQNSDKDVTDIVPLPSECWAKNAPPHSSLMFLGEGQKVTLDEILMGLNTVSGNDAAVAVAMYLFGSVDECIARMNETVKEIGLENTSFVEVSGYSEENMTTARDFITFARYYISQFPQSLEKYHSLKKFTYPKEENLPDGWTWERAQAEGKALDGTLPISQSATNKTLNKILGADGLKTGYIDESGFNLALTVMRNDRRILAVTMGGPGNGTAEGNQYRTEDAITLSNYAYDYYDCITVGRIEPIRMSVLGGRRYCCNFIEISPKDFALSVPIFYDEEGHYLQVQAYRKVLIDDKLPSHVQMGKQYGKVEYYYNDYLIDTRPLVADRTIKKGNIFRRSYAALYIACHK